MGHNGILGAGRPAPSKDELAWIKYQAAESRRRKREQKAAAKERQKWLNRIVSAVFIVLVYYVFGPAPVPPYGYGSESSIKWEINPDCAKQKRDMSQVGKLILHTFFISLPLCGDKVK
jgi:hypothetical protein